MRGPLCGYTSPNFCNSQTEAEKQELNSDLPYLGQGAKYLSHHLPPPRCILLGHQDLEWNQDLNHVCDMSIPITILAVRSSIHLAIFQCTAQGQTPSILLNEGTPKAQTK